MPTCGSCGGVIDEQGHCNCSKFADGTLILAKKHEFSAYEISANPEGGHWNHAGLSKEKGKELLITAIGGKWKLASHQESVDASGSKKFIANDEFLCPNVPEGALIAKIGGNNYGEGSQIFHIGTQGWVPANYEGNIWLACNSRISDFESNSGGVFVVIADSDFSEKGVSE